MAPGCQRGALLATAAAPGGAARNPAPGPGRRSVLRAGPLAARCPGIGRVRRPPDATACPDPCKRGRGALEWLSRASPRPPWTLGHWTSRHWTLQPWISQHLETMHRQTGHGGCLLRGPRFPLDSRADRPDGTQGTQGRQGGDRAAHRLVRTSLGSRFVDSDLIMPVSIRISRHQRTPRPCC